VLQAHLASGPVTIVVHELPSNLVKILSNLARLESFQPRSSQTCTLARSQPYLLSGTSSSLPPEAVLDGFKHLEPFLDPHLLHTHYLSSGRRYRQAWEGWRGLQTPMPVVIARMTLPETRSARSEARTRSFWPSLAAPSLSLVPTTF
jgi:hypothetical protein